jgi:hypothetical protein
MLGLAAAAAAEDAPSHALIAPSTLCVTAELLGEFTFSRAFPEGIGCKLLPTGTRVRWSGQRERKLVDVGLGVARVLAPDGSDGYVIAASLVPVLRG